MPSKHRLAATIAFVHHRAPGVTSRMRTCTRMRKCRMRHLQQEVEAEDDKLRQLID